MQHYKDNQDNIYGYKPECIEVVPVTIEEAQAIIDANKPKPTAASIRAERDAKIGVVMWRYERNARETRLGLFVQDDIAQLDAYVQALADVTEQVGFPENVDWPVEPEVLVEV